MSDDDGPDRVLGSLVRRRRNSVNGQADEAGRLRDGYMYGTRCWTTHVAANPRPE